MIELNLPSAQKFLLENGLTNCQIKKIAGDASFRSYYRVFFQEKTFILMFAPPFHEDVAPFIKIDEILVNNGFRAPKILAKNIDLGFILLEDFGDETYSKALQKNIADEYFLYEKACDALIEIQKISLKNIDILHYNHATLFREVMLFIDWYLPWKNHKISLQQIQDYKFYWIELFDKLSKKNQALVLRDYHADNLMVLNGKNGFDGVGLLDFQDALFGSSAYDLLSLLEDARRDVDEKNKQKLFDYFISKANYNREDFLTDYEIISLQRNIKILGIFARLSLRDGKNQYINFMPRVKNFVEQRLEKINLISPQFKNFLKVYLQ
jgi:aminoglycoside/choline kinase family phosphotransferase